MDLIDTTEKKFLIKNCRRIYRQSIKIEYPPFVPKKSGLIHVITSSWFVGIIVKNIQKWLNQLHTLLLGLQLFGPVVLLVKKT